MFPLLFTKNLPRAISLKGTLIGRTQEKMSGFSLVEVAPERAKKLGFRRESVRVEMRGKVAEIRIFCF